MASHALARATPPVLPALPAHTQGGELALASGHHLAWQQGEDGGRRYFGNEEGAWQLVWDTALCSPAMLLAALHRESELLVMEALHAQAAAEADQRRAAGRREQ